MKLKFCDTIKQEMHTYIAYIGASYMILSCLFAFFPKSPFSVLRIMLSNISIKE